MWSRERASCLPIRVAASHGMGKATQASPPKTHAKAMQTDCIVKLHALSLYIHCSTHSFLGGLKSIPYIFDANAYHGNCSIEGTARAGQERSIVR
jgi:hypothetical protein